MDSETLTYVAVILVSGICLLFSLRYTATRLKSGKITTRHWPNGGGQSIETTYWREHDPILFLFFLALYSAMFNGLPATALYLATNNLWIHLFAFAE